MSKSKRIRIEPPKPKEESTIQFDNGIVLQCTGWTLSEKRRDAWEMLTGSNGQSEVIKPHQKN